MTEEEAKTRWCPFVRIIDMSLPGNDAANRHMQFGGTNPDYCRCIGSACMAWRWWQPPYANEPKGGDGFCGLAGKP